MQQLDTIQHCLQQQNFGAWRRLNRDGKGSDSAETSGGDRSFIDRTLRDVTLATSGTANDHNARSQRAIHPQSSINQSIRCVCVCACISHGVVKLWTLNRQIGKHTRRPRLCVTWPIFSSFDRFNDRFLTAVFSSPN